MERATLSGSQVSTGDVSPVLVAQNRQALVHTSPSIMKVAVLRLQHSALFGHIPLLQMVFSAWRSTIEAVCAYCSLLWSLIFSQSGFMSAVAFAGISGILVYIFPISTNVIINSGIFASPSEITTRHRPLPGGSGV
jgi:hypothetical protein